MKKTLLVFLIVSACSVVCCEAWRWKEWQTYDNCTLRPNKANDGDSFHVRYQKRHYLFRLCFVDTPESDNSLPERVKEQAEYFGLDEAETVKLGKQATKFTAKLLENGFTSYSRLKDARGRSKRKRYYAMIKVNGKYLAEWLVEAGLVRIHGAVDDLPDGTKGKTFIWRLKQKEREAQQKKLGGWAGHNLDRREEMLRRMRTLKQDDAEAVPASKTKSAEVPTKAEAPLPLVYEHDLVIEKRLPVYSLKPGAAQVGVLTSGATVRVLRKEANGMIRIRFNNSAGKRFEAVCKREDLGI